METKRRTEKDREDDSTSSKIDWSRSSNRRVGRSRSRNWNRIRGIHYRNVTKPIIGSKNVPIHDYGVRVDGSDCVVRIDDGVLDFVYVLIEREEAEVSGGETFEW